MTRNSTESPTENDGETTSFGFEDVPRDDRQGMVNRVFSSVAERYDLMNDLMSAGMHRIWKEDLVTQINPPKSNTMFRLLDVAGGTGDIAMRTMKRGGLGSSAVICDISPEMLNVGRRRVADANLADKIELVEGNAEMLPLDNLRFDAYSIAFGIRNVTDIPKAISEAFRVLKPGGHFVCLEFSKCTVPMLDRLYDFHSFEVIPRLGQMATNNKHSYQYLVESIRKFPPQNEFADMIRTAGFEKVSYRNLTGGIAAIHSGWKI